jgi:glutamate/tyrosine decarboxylase-like PLP-dependent enzyme
VHCQVREVASNLRAARSPGRISQYRHLIPSYLSLPPGKGFAGEVWYSHRSAEQTRDSGRALKTFWNIQQAGKTGLVDHVRRHIDLARYLEEVIEASPDLELLATGPLTAVCFRYVPASLRGDDQCLNLLNQAITEDVQVGGRAFLAGTDIRGRFSLRSCALHYALDEGHVQAIVDAVRDAGHRRVRAGAPRQVVDEMTSPMPHHTPVEVDAKCAS